jgi:CRISPR-associated protein Csm5
LTNLITYTWKIETLTPLHIGSGIRLRQGFDFIADKDKIWVADQAAIYEHLIDRAESHAGRQPTEIKNLIRMTLDDIVKNKWLELQDFNLAPAGVFSYVLKGTPSATEGRGEVQAFIRDGFGRPYIPGSSIKGALRSAPLMLEPGI